MTDVRPALTFREARQSGLLPYPEPAAAALEGDVHQPAGSHHTHGTDLDYVLEQLQAHNPIDIETEDSTDEDRAVSRALNHVRADILRRKAVQAGPRHVDYCGTDGDYGRACGPDLGLPQCAYHGRPDTIGQPLAAEVEGR